VATSLGLAALLADDPQAAAAQWRAAIALDGAPAEAFYRLALMLLADAGVEGSLFETPPAVREARELFARGLEVAPEHVDTLVLYARTFLVGNDDPRPAVGAIRKARLARPLDIDALVVESALTARAGAVARAFRAIEGDIRPRNPDKADEAETLAGAGILSAAYDQAQGGDTKGAAGLLADALQHVRDESMRRNLREFHEALTSGDTLVLPDADEASIAVADAALQDYNEAIALANRGELEPAKRKLDELAVACPEPTICKLATERAAELGKVLRHNAAVGALEQAVELYQAGDVKRSVAMLRELELTIEDPALHEQVLDIMKQLGVKPLQKE
jgi:tetratricopeptide (TPR) repeat protein